MQKTSTLIFTLVFTNTLLFGQIPDGPGGVGNSSTVQFWLDPSQIGVSDLANFSTWPDRSGNGHDFTIGLASARPQYDASFAGFGGQPAVRFWNGDWMDSPSVAALNTDDITWITVQDWPAAGATRVNIRSNYSSSSTQWGTYEVSNRFYPSVRSGGLKAASYAKISGAHIHSNIWDGVTNVLSSYHDGGFQNSIGGVTTTPSGHNFTRVGANSNVTNSFFNSRIGEVIVYSMTLNTAQNIIVNNYLSTKYSIALVADDKYAHDGSHPNDVAGIGREDASNLHTDAQGSGIIRINSPSALGNDEYLMWGHNGAATQSTAAGTPLTYQALPTSGRMLERQWRVSETGGDGDVGEITLTIDITGIGFGSLTAYELLVDSDGDFSDAVQIPANSVIANIAEFTVPGATLQDGYYFTLGNTDVEIISIVDGQDWNDPTTWSCTCVPDCADFITIDNGHNVTVTVDQVIGELTINPTGTLTVNAGITVSFCDNLDVDGLTSFDATSLVIFNGSSAQTIDVAGTMALGSMQVNNTSTGVTHASGTITISDSLQVEDGALTFSGTDFRLLSDASGTARFGQLGSGGSTSGNITFERFIPAGVGGYRDLASPFLSGATLNEWDDSLIISCPNCPDGCAYGGSCFESIKIFNNGTQSLEGISNISTSLVQTRGYYSWLSDDLSSLSSDVTIVWNGQLTNTAFTDFLGGPEWSMTGNPYASQIDFDEIFASGSYGNYFYVYNPVSKSFEYWDGDLQTPSTPELAGGIIAAGQGFWVYNTAPGVRLMRFYQTGKVSAADNFIRDEHIANESISLRLHSKGTAHSCEMSVKFLDDADNFIDFFDMRHMSSPDTLGVNLYTKASSERLRINALSPYAEEHALDVFITVPVAGEYSITHENLEVFDQYSSVILEDMETGARHCLDSFDEYPFYANETNSEIMRFRIHFSNDLGCSTTAAHADQSDFTVNAERENVLIMNHGEDNAARVLIHNAIGQEIYSEEHTFESFEQISIPKNISWNSNVIIVTIQTAGSTSTHKLFLN